MRLWFANKGLNDGRFPDERYILDNVASFLTEGSLRPVHLYYPGLINLLQSLLLGTADALARWSGRGSQTIMHGWEFTPTAYFLARSFQAFFGVLTLYWTYRLGRRLLSPRAGLLAALALAAVPMHLRLSVVVKPDILLLLGLLIAAEATVVALARGQLGFFLAAGAAVGLATAAKYNGVTAALPLAALALPGARREPAVLARLAAAGAASLLVFLLINPFFFVMLGKFQRDFGTVLTQYKAKAAETGAAGASRLEALQIAPSIVIEPEFHGVVTGVLGLTGLVVIGAWAWRHHDRGLALLTLFPLTYVALYAAMTIYSKFPNYLPVCPFIALGAGALVAEAAQRLRGRQAPIFAALIALWCVMLVWQPMDYAYREIVPTTCDEAMQFLHTRLAPLADTRVLYQLGATDDEIRLRVGRNLALVRQIEPGDRADLDLADAEIFTPDSLADRAMAGHLASASQVVRIVPRPFRVRGEPLTLALHPWEPTGKPIELEAGPFSRPTGTWIIGRPADLAFPTVVSFEVIVPKGSAVPDEVTVGTHGLALLPGGNHGQRWLTERLRLANLPGGVAITGLSADVKPQSVRLHLWADRAAGAKQGT